jgi:hypothetical protein
MSIGHNFKICDRKSTYDFLLRYMDSDYPLGIFKLVLNKWCNVSYLVSDSQLCSGSLFCPLSFRDTFTASGFRMSLPNTNPTKTG